MWNAPGVDQGTEGMGVGVGPPALPSRSWQVEPGPSALPQPQLD